MILEIVLGIIVLVQFYVIWNTMRKIESLEDVIINYNDRAENVQRAMKEIDSTGHFEADDEIGTIFESIKDVINTLTVTTEEGETVDAS